MLCECVTELIYTDLGHLAKPELLVLCGLDNPYVVAAEGKVQTLSEGMPFGDVQIDVIVWMVEESCSS